MPDGGAIPFDGGVRRYTEEQQPPVKGQGTDVWLLVLADMEERRRYGIAKYGEPVRADNGRDPLVDAYQEALDLCVYLRQELERRRIGGKDVGGCPNAVLTRIGDEGEGIPDMREIGGEGG